MENNLSQNLKFFQKIDFVLIRLNHLIFVFYRNDQKTSFQYFWTTLTFQYPQLRIHDKARRFWIMICPGSRIPSHRKNQVCLGIDFNTPWRSFRSSYYDIN